jgi:hypothetical protein
MSNKPVPPHQLKMVEDCAKALVGHTVDDIAWALSNLIAGTARTIDPSHPHKFVMHVMANANDFLDVPIEDCLKIVATSGTCQ